MQKDPTLAIYLQTCKITPETIASPFLSTFVIWCAHSESLGIVRSQVVFSATPGSDRVPSETASR